MNIEIKNSAEKVKVAQSCPILCDPMDCSQPGSFVRGTIQARILEWVAIYFSGDLPHTGLETWSPILQADSLQSEPSGQSTSKSYPRKDAE